MEKVEKVKLVFPVVAVRSGSDFDVASFEEAMEKLTAGEISEDEVLQMFSPEEVKTPMLLVRWPSRQMRFPEEMAEQLKLANKPIPSISITSAVTGAALAGLDKISERLKDGHMTGIEIEFDVTNLKFTKTLNYMYLAADSVNLDNLVDVEPVFKCSEEAGEEMVKKARMLNRLASMRIRANMSSQTVSPSGNIIPKQDDQSVDVKDVNMF